MLRRFGKFPDGIGQRMGRGVVRCREADARFQQAPRQWSQRGQQVVTTFTQSPLGQSPDFLLDPPEQQWPGKGRYRKGTPQWSQKSRQQPVVELTGEIRRVELPPDGLVRPGQGVEAACW